MLACMHDNDDITVIKPGTDLARGMAQMMGASLAALAFARADHERFTEFCKAKGSPVLSARLLETSGNVLSEWLIQAGAGGIFTITHASPAARAIYSLTLACRLEEIMRTRQPASPQPGPQA